MPNAELQLNTLISNATMRNWSRLDYSATTKLKSRANKKLSKKIIIPTEYFSNINNIGVVENVLNSIRRLDIDISDALYSLSINLLTKHNLIDKPHVQQTLAEYKKYRVSNELLYISLPDDEKDILGIIYQSLLSEGEKNITGTYYTTNSITVNMTEDLDFSHDETFFDPCCGSGAFILALKNVKPTQIFGADINPIAVMIAKVNLLLKYIDYEFIPQIYCYNYLENDNGNYECYDYIVTNPPWGVTSTVKSLSNTILSKESFSLFFEKAYYQLRKNGIIRFLFPESILNVKTHKDIREFILENGDLQQIQFYSNTFNGVTTKIIDILLKKTTKTPFVCIKKNRATFSVSKTAFSRTQNKVFNILNEEDVAIVEKVKKLGKYSLADSIWALGVVTGDNKTKLRPNLENGFERIFTGKEITPYRLKPAKNYILYDRKQLQQVAKEEYYRAKEKLAYKFISNKLVFAYDNTSSLFLNSANILIPKIPNMSIKTVLGFLNSELYQYLYCTLFAEIKVLKGNLIELPFIDITQEQDNLISTYVQNILDGKDDYIVKVQEEIYKLFEIDDLQIKYIREKINGTFNK